MTDHVCAWAAASPARYRRRAPRRRRRCRRGRTRRAPRPGCWRRSQDAEHLDADGSGLAAARLRIRARARRSPRVAMTVDVSSRRDVGDRSHVRDVHISTAPDAGVHDPTAIVRGMSSAISPPSRPSCAPRSSLKRSSVGLPRFPAAAPAVAVPRSGRARRRGLPRRRFAAADQIAFDRQDVDHSPLGVEALLRGPMAAWVTTAPRSLSRCTASM